MGKSAVGAGRPRASAHKGRGHHSRSSARRRALRRESILGRAVRGIDGERKPLHAAGRACAVEQHARLLPGWESLTPGSRRTDLGGLRARSTGTDGGGLPQPECLHSGSYWKPTGDGVAARRRLRRGFWQLAAVRRHQSRSQRRRRRRVGDPPAEPVWLPAPLEFQCWRELGAREQTVALFLYGSLIPNPETQETKDI